MKQFFIYLILALPVMLHSCGNEDAVSDENVTTATVSPDVAKMQTVAKLLTGLTSDQRIAAEVKAGVERSLIYGLDEEFRFTDILQPKGSKMLRSGGDNLLTESVRNLLDGYSSTSGLRSSGNDLETFLLDGNVQIYWPYSEDWDGKETPVITFDPGTGNADKVTAYKIVKLPDGTVAADSFIVDEAYAMKHPVWVINKNDVDYDDLPDFANGEYENKGTVFNGRALNDQVKLRAADKIYELSLKTMKCTTQHDDWVNGGSEFYIACYFPTSQFGISEHKRYQTFTRKEISKATVKTINEILNYDWSDDQIHNKFKVWESDSSWGNTSFDVEVQYKDGNQTTTVKSSFKMGNQDDPIMDETVKRTVFNTQSTVSSGTISAKSFNYRGVTIDCEIMITPILDFFN